MILFHIEIITFRNFAAISVFICSVHCLNVKVVMVFTAGELLFDGDSKQLKATKVLPTLDGQIRREMNTIWCASFQSAWKALEDLAKEPPAFKTTPEIAFLLNQSIDPRPYIPVANLYTAAGFCQQGIVDQIRKDLMQKFLTKSAPAFPGISPDSFVAYAYLEANLQFSLPYFQSRNPLIFYDRSGNKAELSSFGIRPEDEFAYFELRKQPVILFEARNEDYKISKYIVDLDRTSNPDQIILALVEPKSTLVRTLEYVEAKIAMAGNPALRQGLGPNDVLLVPNIAWQITHRFTEL